MTPDQPWMWHWGGMWIFPTFMFMIMIIFMFVFFMRGGCMPPLWGMRGHHNKGEESEAALDILKKRYAKGEITKEEFELIKKDILS